MINKIKEIIISRAYRVDFEESNHSYLVGDVLYTPVSNTLSWYNQGMDKIPEKVLKQAMDRGTAIHKVLEDHINGKFIDGAYPEFKDFILKGINLYEKRQSQGWKLLATEQVLIDVPLKLAGTVDLLLWDYDDDKGITYLHILDWKTGNAKMADRLQVAAYQYLLEKTLGKRIMSNVVITTELAYLKG